MLKFIKNRTHPVYLAFILLSVFLYALTVRGSLGNPSPEEIDFQLSSSGKAFETSQERSRYAVLLALYNNKSVRIDEFASMGTPDVGVINGRYYSFFPPTVSLLAYPLYVLGLKIGAAQISAFSISTIFAFLTSLLIIKYCFKLGLHWTVSLFSAVAFAFATNAWGYSVTLYAHLISAFCILAGVYIISFQRIVSLKKAVLVFILYGFAVYIDYPNLFVFFPIALSLVPSFIEFKKKRNQYAFKLNFRYLIAPLVFLFMLGLYGYYNYTFHGDPFTFSNNLPRVRDLKIAEESIPEDERKIVGALQPRLLLQGLNSFLVSLDRSVLVYSPVALLFVFGLFKFKKELERPTTILLSIPALCLFLYSMFGDPYGGWAFGSRYMIAALPELVILAGVGLQKFYQNLSVKILYSLIFVYSASVSALAPITTNVIPPLVEARGLNLESTYIINIRMLSEGITNSFVYNSYLRAFLPPYVFYFLILSIVLTFGWITIWLPKKSEGYLR